GVQLRDALVEGKVVGDKEEAEVLVDLLRREAIGKVEQYAGHDRPHLAPELLRCTRRLCLRLLLLLVLRQGSRRCAGVKRAHWKRAMVRGKKSKHLRLQRPRWRRDRRCWAEQ